jgi:hypothetical protein
MADHGTAEAVLAGIRARVATWSGIDFEACHKAASPADAARLRVGMIDAIAWGMFVHLLNPKPMHVVRRELLEKIFLARARLPDNHPGHARYRALAAQVPSPCRPRMLAFEAFIRALAKGYEAATGRPVSHRGRFPRLVVALLPYMTRFAQHSGRPFETPNSTSLATIGSHIERRVLHKR